MIGLGYMRLRKHLRCVHYVHCVLPKTSSRFFTTSRVASHRAGGVNWPLHGSVCDGVARVARLITVDVGGKWRHSCRCAFRRLASRLDGDAPQSGRRRRRDLQPGHETLPLLAELLAEALVADAVDEEMRRDDDRRERNRRV